MGDCDGVTLDIPLPVGITQNVALFVTTGVSHDECATLSPDGGEVYRAPSMCPTSAI